MTKQLEDSAAEHHLEDRDLAAVDPATPRCVVCGTLGHARGCPHVDAISAYALAAPEPREETMSRTHRCPLSVGELGDNTRDVDVGGTF